MLKNDQVEITVGRCPFSSEAPVKWGTFNDYPVAGSTPKWVEMGDTLRGEDIVCSHWRQWAGTIAYRDSVTHYLDKRFDGDTSSLNSIMTDEGVQEVYDLFKKKEAWVDPRGGMIASANVDTVALVLKNMTS